MKSPLKSNGKKRGQIIKNKIGLSISLNSIPTSNNHKMAKKILKKILTWQVISAILFTIATAWNVYVGGTYTLELAIGLLVLTIIKGWTDYLNA